MQNELINCADIDLADKAIIELVLPKAYQLISDLISSSPTGSIPKNLLLDCKKLLPDKYPHSFAYENSLRKAAQLSKISV